MIKFLNVLLVMSSVAAASVMYRLEHATRGLERENAKTSARIVEAEEEFKLLKGEWSSLTRPERIERLAMERLELRPVEATQLMPHSELAALVQAQKDAIKARQTEIAEAAQ